MSAVSGKPRGEMRTEAEIKRAIAHLEDAMDGGALEGDTRTMEKVGAVISALLWTLGRETEFSVMIAKCEQVDVDAKRMGN